MGDTDNVNDMLEKMNKKDAQNEVVIEEKLLPKAKPAKGETYNITLQMHKDGMSVNEISKQRNLAKSTIEGHLARFVETGEIDVFVFLKEYELKKLNEYIAQHPQAFSSEIFNAFENKYSSTQIKAAMAYRTKVERENADDNFIIEECFVLKMIVQI